MLRYSRSNFMSVSVSGMPIRLALPHSAGLSQCHLLSRRLMMKSAVSPGKWMPVT